MVLKVYGDRLSQPVRAVLVFCKVNGIEFEEVGIELSKKQHKTPEYKEINPLGKIPAITDGEFKLAESHAILSYLASAYPGVPDHWYPSDLFARAKTQCILDWHHSNLRRATPFILNSLLAPSLGLPLNLQAAKNDEKVVEASLTTIENLWLIGEAKFLLGNTEPSVADLSLVCEIMELELLEDEAHERIFGHHKKILQWVENVKSATSPHFQQVHEILYQLKPLFLSNLASAKNNN